MKRIVLLGASGSIGLQTIDVVKQHTDEFEIVAAGVGRNIKALREILDAMPIAYVSIQDETNLTKLEQEYPQTKFFVGEEGITSMMKSVDYDVLVNALVGARGLVPTLLAIETNHDVALANKESLVVGGELVKVALANYGQKLYPIDSEHSAIFQCLQGSKENELERLIITASGGSFRELSREDLQSVTKEQALNHPNWSMGQRITIDSATMMNKGFEVIEAHYLFDIDYEHIDVVMHKESLVHSFVEFKDSALLAQVGNADMRVPIQFALSYPNRLPLETKERFNFLNHPTWHFEELSTLRFPLLKTAYEVGRRKGNAGAILNAADEVSVELFLKGEISFLDIETSIHQALENVEFIEHPTLDDLLETDKRTRDYVYNIWKGDNI